MRNLCRPINKIICFFGGEKMAEIYAGLMAKIYGDRGKKAQEDAALSARKLAENEPEVRREKIKLHRPPGR